MVDESLLFIVKKRLKNNSTKSLFDYHKDKLMLNRYDSAITFHVDAYIQRYDHNCLQCKSLQSLI